jgi:HlyD family secretion protein
VVTPGSAVAAGDLLIQLSNPQIVQAAQEAELHVRAAEAELRSRRLQLASAVLQQEAVVAAARVESTEAGDRARADNELAAAGLTSALTLKASQGKAEQLGVRADVEQKRLDLLRRSEVTDLSAEESRLEQLRALAGLRRQELDALHIRAGRAGIVQQVAVEAGQRVAAGTNLARVAAPEPLKAVLQISQLEAAAVVPGQRVQVDLHGGVVEGTVSRIDPAVQNGSVAVDVRLPRELPPAARPDLSVDAAIEIERAPRALQTGRPVHVRANTEVALFRLSADGTGAVRVPVRIGRTSFNRIEILSGLRAGDRVVLSGTQGYETSDHITITD